MDIFFFDFCAIAILLAVTLWGADVEAFEKSQLLPADLLEKSCGGCSSVGLIHGMTLVELPCFPPDLPADLQKWWLDGPSLLVIEVDRLLVHENEFVHFIAKLSRKLQEWTVRFLSCCHCDLVQVCEMVRVE